MHERYKRYRYKLTPDKIYRDDSDGKYYIAEKIGKNRYYPTGIGGKTKTEAKKAWKEFAQRANLSNAAMLEELKSWDGR
jgi:hypothetical protein